MARTEVFDTIDRLRAEARPFCTATVIRSAGATSAKAGAKVAVTDAGEILGHLGGACVTRAVRAAAAAALADGAVRTIRVEPDPPEAADGLEHFRSGCPSGGTLDLLIEPFRQPPVLAVLGTSPVARAIARQAALLDYRLAAAETPDGLGALGPGDFVVVAAQGSRDLDALRAALASPAAYVAMVASRRKAAALVDRLRAEGMAEARLARLHAPAGLDIGALDPEEIAVSILAEIIGARRRGPATSR